MRNFSKAVRAGSVPAYRIRLQRIFRLAGIVMLAVSGGSPVWAQAVDPNYSEHQIRAFVSRFLDVLPNMRGSDAERFLGGSYARDQQRLLSNPEYRRYRASRIASSEPAAPPSIEVYPYGPKRYLVSVQKGGLQTIYVVKADRATGIRIIGEVEQYLVCGEKPPASLEVLCR